MLPVRVTDHVRFQYCQGLFSVHFGSTWLLPYILCLTDKGDRKHASKHDFSGHSAPEQKLCWDYLTDNDWIWKIDKWCKIKDNMQTFSPWRTSSYASDLRSMQFNVKPFIDKVSVNQKGNGPINKKNAQRDRVIKRWRENKLRKQNYHSISCVTHLNN